MTRSWRSQIADEVRASSRMTPKWPDDAMKRIAEVVAERDAALAEVARLSTPPDDAEVAELVEDLRDTASIHKDDASEVGEYRRVMAEELAKEALAAADAVARLSHALAAETAKREAMEAALYGLAKACEGEPSEVFAGEIGGALTHAHATLAKHGSKT